MYVRLIVLILIVSVASLTACKNNNDAPTPITALDSLNVVNASVDTINAYMNGSRLNRVASIYPATATGYYTVLSGSQVYSVKKYFNTTTIIPQPLFDLTLNLDPKLHYNSFFVAGETAAQAFSTVDTLKALAKADTCYIRFVNASPTVGNLDVAIGDTVKFNNVPFKGAGGFKLVGISGKKPIRVYLTGTTTPILSTTVNLGANHSYTFYSMGSLNGQGNAAFRIGSMVNYY